MPLYQTVGDDSRHSDVIQQEFKFQTEDTLGIDLRCTKLLDSPQQCLVRRHYSQAGETCHLSN